MWPLEPGRRDPTSKHGNKDRGKEQHKGGKMGVGGVRLVHLTGGKTISFTTFRNDLNKGYSRT